MSVCNGLRALSDTHGPQGPEGGPGSRRGLGASARPRVPRFPQRRPRGPPAATPAASGGLPWPDECGRMLKTMNYETHLHKQLS